MDRMFIPPSSSLQYRRSDFDERVATLFGAVIPLRAGNFIGSLFLFAAISLNFAASAEDLGPGIVIYSTFDHARDEIAIAVPFTKVEQYQLVTNVTTTDGKIIRVTKNQLKQIVRPTDLARATVVDDASIRKLRQEAKSLRAMQERYPLAITVIAPVADRIERAVQAIESGNVLVKGSLVPRANYEKQMAASAPKTINLTLDGRIYSGARLSSVSGESVSIMHSGGAKSVTVAQLSDEQISQLNSTSTSAVIEGSNEVVEAKSMSLSPETPEESNSFQNSHPDIPPALLQAFRAWSKKQFEGTPGSFESFTIGQSRELLQSKFSKFGGGELSATFSEGTVTLLEGSVGKDKFEFLLISNRLIAINNHWTDWNLSRAQFKNRDLIDFLGKGSVWRSEEWAVKSTFGNTGWLYARENLVNLQDLGGVITLYLDDVNVDKGYASSSFTLFARDHVESIFLPLVQEFFRDILIAEKTKVPQSGLVVSKFEGRNSEHDFRPDVFPVVEKMPISKGASFESSASVMFFNCLVECAVAVFPPTDKPEHNKDDLGYDVTQWPTEGKTNVKVRRTSIGSFEISLDAPFGL